MLPLRQASTPCLYKGQTSADVTPEVGALILGGPNQSLLTLSRIHRGLLWMLRRNLRCGHLTATISHRWRRKSRWSLIQRRHRDKSSRLRRFLDLLFEICAYAYLAWTWPGTDFEVNRYPATSRGLSSNYSDIVTQHHCQLLSWLRQLPSHLRVRNHGYSTSHLPPHVLVMQYVPNPSLPLTFS